MKKLNIKILILLIFVLPPLMLVVYHVFILLFYPTDGPRNLPEPINTNNWKKYTNEKYGYTFKFPPEAHTAGSGSQVFIYNPDTGAAAEYYLAEIRSDVFPKRFDTYFNTPDMSYVEQSGDYKLRNLKFGGFDAVEYSFNRVDKDKEQEEQKRALRTDASVGRIYFNRGVIINKGGVIYEISTNFYTSDYKQIFDQILLSFKFNGSSNNIAGLIAKCGGFPNDGVVEMSDTGRSYFGLPKNIYAKKDLKVTSNGATMGEVSNYENPEIDTNLCWQGNYEFDLIAGENGYLDIFVPSADPDYDDYRVRVNVWKYGENPYQGW